MKKFITYMPRQPELGAFGYEAVDNQKLHFGDPNESPKATAFPIIPVISGYTESDEEIAVIAFTERYEFSERNYKLFENEILTLCSERGIVLRDGAIKKVTLPYDDGVTSQIESFQLLVDSIEDGDELYACLSYSSKPAEITELMALRYARMVYKDVYIACAVYGQVNFKLKEAKIYDETALVYLDDIVRMLAQYGDKNPKETIRRMLSL